MRLRPIYNLISLIIILVGGIILCCEDRGLIMAA
jgi:hypothetical protein